MTTFDRSIDIILSRGTWTGGRQPPPTLLALSGSRNVDMRQAFAEINRRTAPPLSRGFTLAECWAWFRYFPALADRQDLRLREEWTDLDPHQKTILSDDFGVGITMLLLGEALDLTSVCQTGYFLSQVQAGEAYLKRSGRRGPSKSPDFVALDRAGSYHVIECKGTQSDRATLRNQLSGGIAQKQNIVLAKLTRGESLVAGCFVPQWTSQEAACLEIWDPEPYRPIQIDLEVEDVIEILMRGQLASQLHSVGLPTLGNRVAQRERTHALQDPAVQRELEPFTIRERDGRRYRARDVSLPIGDIREGQRRPYRIKVSFAIDEEMLQAVGSTNQPLHRLRFPDRIRRDRLRATEVSAAIEDDLGFETEIHVDEG